MKSTKRWYFPTVYKGDEEKLRAGCWILWTLCCCLLCLYLSEGYKSGKAEKQIVLMDQVISALDSQVRNMESGLLDCVDGKRIHLQFVGAGYATVACKREETNLWNTPNKSSIKRKK